MKRSEAIRILCDKINEDQYIDYQVHDYQVSEALQLLEEAGIVRPIKKLSNSETLVINQFGQVLAKTEDSEVIEIGWEEE